MRLTFHSAMGVRPVSAQPLDWLGTTSPAITIEPTGFHPGFLIQERASARRILVQQRTPAEHQGPVHCAVPTGAATLRRLCDAIPLRSRASVRKIRERAASGTTIVSERNPLSSIRKVRSAGGCHRRDTSQPSGRRDQTGSAQVHRTMRSSNICDRSTRRSATGCCPWKRSDSDRERRLLRGSMQTGQVPSEKKRGLDVARIGRRKLPRRPPRRPGGDGHP